MSEGTTQATSASSDAGRSVLTIGHSRHPIGDGPQLGLFTPARRRTT